MAGSGGIIQAELSIQVGQALAQLKAASDALSKFGKDAGAGMKPANDAVGSVTDKFKEFKREQVQQGRLVGFYTKEIGEFVNLSEGAKSAIGGFGGALVELATGAGPIALVFAGMELLKGAVGLYREETERAKEEAENFAKVQLAVAKATVAARDELNKLAGPKGDPPDKARRDVMKAAEPGIADASEAIVAATPTKWALIRAFIWDGALGVKRVQEEAAKLSKTLDTVIASAKDIAATASALSFDESSEAMNAYWTMKAEQEKHNREVILDLRGREAALMEPTAAAERRHAVAVEKIKEDLLLSEASRNRALALADREYKLALERIRLDAIQARTLQEIAKAEKDGAFETSGQDWLHKTPTQVNTDAEKNAAKAWPKELMAGPGNDEGESTFAANAASAKSLAEMWEAVAGAVGNAASSFAQLGAAIGGAAGEMVGKMMEVVVSAIKMAIAIAAASAASVPIVGWLNAAAAAVSLAATLASVMAGVSGGRELGGRVLPGTYWVGEAGPELLQIPAGVSGYVVPNHALALAGARAAPAGGAVAAVNLTFNAPVDATWWRSNQRHIVQTLREAARSGRA